MKEIIIKDNEAGQRLDKFLAKYLDQSPKSFLYKMLRKKNITLNGKKAAGKEILQLGDQVKLFLSDETIGKFSNHAVSLVNSKLDIVYEDPHLLVLNKPANMLSQKAKKEDVSMVEHVISYMVEQKELSIEDLKSFKPSICNRLDRNTTGILVAGKTLLGLQTMGEIFQLRSLKKFYRCIVVGKITKKQTLKGYLIKDEKTNQVKILENERKDSLFIQTEYTPIATNGEFTLLEIHLITGRSHQIRAHLFSIGHPIIGDRKYGNGKINQMCKNKYGLSDQLLHSYRLEMPVIEGELSYLSHEVWIAPLPFLFQKIGKDMGLLEEK